MSDIIPTSQQVQLGSIDTADPVEFFAKAKQISQALADLVTDQKLYSVISGRKYVQVSGWAYAGAMMGVLAREVSSVEQDNGDYESVVELFRASDGVCIGRGSAIVGHDEKVWTSRPRYSRKSMATTRAEGKAFRLAFPWLMALAGYEATPAEEMQGIVEGEVKEVAKPVRPFEAEYLREYVAKRVKETTPTNASQEQIGLAAAMIEYPFADKDKKTAENMRRSIVKYLLGKPSLKDAPGEEITVLLNWLKPAKDSGGAYTPDRNAQIECEKVWTAAQLEAGQMPIS